MLTMDDVSLGNIVFLLENVYVQNHLLHGDMIVNPVRAGHKVKKWTNGIIHYVYDPSIGEFKEFTGVLLKTQSLYMSNPGCIKGGLLTICYFL